MTALALLGLDDAARRFLVDAAHHAAHELGLFAARPAAPSRRMAALLDLLAATGAPGTRVPAPPPPSGWGLLAEVIRRDAPAPLDPADPRYHAHLAAAGAPAARAAAARLPAGELLDLGAGIGTYARAYLAAHPAGRATLVDRAEVLALAGDLGPRVRTVAADLRDLPELAAHDVALLANVLHLYPAETCAALVRRAAAAVRPGGRVAIVDVAIARDRSGPLDALLFALDMALYADGTVYDDAALAGFLAAAGLDAPAVTTLPDGMWLLTARKSS